MTGHIGHGDGLDLFVGRIRGCPACDAMDLRHPPVAVPGPAPRPESTPAELDAHQAVTAALTGQPPGELVDPAGTAEVLATWTTVLLELWLATFDPPIDPAVFWEHRGNIGRAEGTNTP